MTSSLAPAITELAEVHAAMTRLDAECAPYLDSIPEAQQASARNLLDYLALRCHDLRHVQAMLASHGLSSLGRTESHVRNGVETVLRALHTLDGEAWDPPPDGLPVSKSVGDVLLESHTDALLGPPPPGRTVRIMVTMPSEAGSDYLLVRELVAAGMDCMRINCAHDAAGDWERMISNLTRANHELQRACRLSMDIAGPKLRTGSITAGPAVVKIKPQRDVLGTVTRPAFIALIGAGRHRAIALPVDQTLTLDDEPPSDINPDEPIEVTDTRGKTRRLRLRAHQDGVVIAELDRTAYIVSGTSFTFSTAAGVVTRRVVDVPPKTDTLTLKKGDTLILTPDSQLGRPAIRDDSGRALMPAYIGITLPEVFQDVQSGQTVWFDDGKIGGVVREVEGDEIRVEVIQARAEGSRLAAGKGVNLPETNLRLSALTAKDIDDLTFIARHADLIGYSFVRHAQDIHQLQDHLAALGAEHIGTILKIETRHAFAELPKLLLACMHTGKFGVMIARGDLAVECGFERMAEVQEEILWICEAAHTPVVWATQVLESLAKTGLPSRAEVSDAAMSERAECVMLNKGPFIVDAVTTLDNILRRMQAHQSKKRAMLRPLHLAHAALSELQQHERALS